MMWNREAAIQLIKREGRTRDWIAEQCGIETESLNHILTGRRNPSRPVLILLANALKTSLESLSGEEQGAAKTTSKDRIAAG
jgi:transcriptional regulator with XRE-family HTH domain